MLRHARVTIELGERRGAHDAGAAAVDDRGPISTGPRRSRGSGRSRAAAWSRSSPWRSTDWPRARRRRARRAWRSARWRSGSTRSSSASRAFLVDAARRRAARAPARTARDRRRGRGCGAGRSGELPSTTDCPASRFAIDLSRVFCSPAAIPCTVASSAWNRSSSRRPPARQRAQQLDLQQAHRIDVRIAQPDRTLERRLALRAAPSDRADARTRSRGEPELGFDRRRRCDRALVCSASAA